MIGIVYFCMFFFSPKDLYQDFTPRTHDQNCESNTGKVKVIKLYIDKVLKVSRTRNTF